MQRNPEETGMMVNTLLEVCDQVLEISKDHILTRVWYNENGKANASENISGNKITDTPYKEIDTAVEKGFASGKNRTWARIEINGKPTMCRIDILPILADKNLLLAAINIQETDATIVKYKNDKGQDAAFTHPAFFEQILDAIPADIAMYDAEHTYLFVNKSAFKNDEARQWIIGKTDADYAKKRNKPDSFYKKRFELIDKAIAEKKEIDWIEPIERKDGTKEFQIRIAKPVISGDGTAKYVLGYGLNITDIILTQESLKASIETFSNVFEHSGVGMSLISPFGHWLDMNSVITSLTGFSKEELQQLNFQDLTYEEDANKDADLIKQMLKKEISSYTVEKRYVSKDKKIIWVSLTLSMVWNNDGSPRFFIAQILDISQRKELEREVNQRNQELEATKSSLINKVKQLEELSYVIAHNLRGAAGNIKAISGAMVAHYAGGEAAEANPLSTAFTPQEAMTFIEEASVSLMDSLSTLMKITEIKLNNRIPYNVCDVNSIINDILGQLNSVIYEKKAEITKDLMFTQISYPKAYLENILYNLISNALKYAKPGVTPDIKIITRMWNGKTQLIVKDNGLGIDMHKYGDSIFKLNNTFHRGFDSKGVGLYITKTQVESLGGSIVVLSEQNEGSEFIVTLGE